MDGYGVIILAGGGSLRMGADKALLDWGGRRAVDRVADLAASLGIDELVVSGPDFGLPFVLDPLPDGGPVGGLMAAAGYLAGKGCTRALVLAVDAPTLTANDIAPLLTQPCPGAVYRGFPLPMAVALSALPPSAEAGWRLRRLAAEARLTELEASESQALRLRGANTPQEWAALMTAPPIP